MSIDRSMDKEVVVHIRNGILFSHKKTNELESVEVSWMNLEPVIQSELIQKEENKQYIYSYIWNLEKCS